jgi:hypothetical protein
MIFLKRPKFCLLDLKKSCAAAAAASSFHARHSTIEATPVITSLQRLLKGRAAYALLTSLSHHQQQQQQYEQARRCTPPSPLETPPLPILTSGFVQEMGRISEQFAMCPPLPPPSRSSLTRFERDFVDSIRAATGQKCFKGPPPPPPRSKSPRLSASTNKIAAHVPGNLQQHSLPLRFMPFVCFDCVAALFAV